MLMVEWLLMNFMELEIELISYVRLASYLSADCSNLCMNDLS